MDACFSFLIKVNECRFLVWSSEYAEGAVPADVLFVKPHQEGPYSEALLNVVQLRVVIPIHWDDFMRPLSKPLRPMIKPPRLTFPPLQRVNLAKFRQLIKPIAPQADVFLPEIFRWYELREFL